MGAGGVMQSQDRKAAVAAYKERKSVAGIFAIRCAAVPQVWIGKCPNIDTIQNQIWFTLRHGSHPARGLQDAWRAHGSAAFTFEALERLDGDDTDFVRAVRLRDRATYWRATLGGLPM
jgi:hypothetical protein